MKTQAAINDFLRAKLAQNLSQLTIPWYRAKLEQFSRVCPNIPRDPRPIESFLAGLNYSKVTKVNYFSALRAFFRFARERYNVRNPMTKMRPPLLTKEEEDSAMATLEPEEEMRLLNSASSLRDRAILTLLIDSGIRSGELAQLRQQDIKGEIIQVCGKTGRRYIPISEETRRLILSLVAQGGKDNYVFHGHKGPLTRHGVYRIVSAHMIRAGIQGPKLGAHRVRHAFGKGFLVNGGDTRSLQRIMGHARITTTEKYSALSLPDIIAKHHKFTPLHAVHAAAQEVLFDTDQAIKEAENIISSTGEAQE